jgi:hypothetical protein
VRRTFSADPATRELQDEARARSGRQIGERWRTLEGKDEGQDAVLFQRFTGGRVWKTVAAIRADGTFRTVP